MVPPFFAMVAYYVGSLFGTSPDTDHIVKMLSEGKSDEISGYFNPSIQLTTPGKEGVYSKAQAKMILSDFFDNNLPTGAKLKSKGNSDNGAQFVTIELNTGSNSFKVNIFYRGAGPNLKIHELKIEK